MFKRATEHPDSIEKNSLAVFMKAAIVEGTQQGPLHTLSHSEITRLFDSVPAQSYQPLTRLLQDNLLSVFPEHMSGAVQVKHHHAHFPGIYQIKNALVGILDMLMTYECLSSAFQNMPDDATRARCKRDLRVAFCNKLIGMIFTPLIAAAYMQPQAKHNLSLFRQYISQINNSVSTAPEDIHQDIKNHADQEICKQIRATLGILLNDNMEIIVSSILDPLFLKNIARLNNMEEIQKTSAGLYLSYFGENQLGEFNNKVSLILTNVLMTYFLNEKMEEIKSFHAEIIRLLSTTQSTNIISSFTMNLQGLIRQHNTLDPALSHTLRARCSQLPFTCRFQVEVGVPAISFFQQPIEHSHSMPQIAPLPGGQESPRKPHLSPKPIRRHSDSIIHSPATSPRSLPKN